MEKKLMLPANYNVMNEEEMTYTSGGDGFTAPFAVGWTIGAVISGSKGHQCRCRLHG